jgi:hypothetical protein
LKRLSILEVQNERAKCELALLFDFTFPEAFKIFDKSGKRIVEAEDILHTLHAEFNYTHFSIQEIGLFLKRYDKYQERKLNIYDFAEAFTPREPIFAEYVRKKADCLPERIP